MQGHGLSFLVAWSMVIIVSVAWNYHLARENSEEKARIEARTLYELNLVYRRWSALHGGVYVPVTEALQPNPYLQTPLRDVTTNDGRALTLVNPAWMTRQVFELLAKQSTLPFLNHLTSLKYIHPANKPDAWEEQGLRAFERGQTEVSVRAVIQGQPYMRLLKPFKTEEGCLKCHGHQGYKVGDIRGGLGISIPLAPYLAAEKREKTGVAGTHFLLWIIGAVGIAISTRSLQTKQLAISESEEKYRLLFQNHPNPMWVYDSETLRFLMINDAAVQQYGFSRQEFLSMTIKDIRPPEDVEKLMQKVAEVSDGIDHAGIWRHLKKDGTLIFVEITTHSLLFEGRRAELVIASDVTKRMKLEDQLRHAQKMEAVGRLAGGVAHDFNNILTAIIGYSSLLLMKMKSEEPLRHNAEEIIASAQRGAALTQHLLAFSRKQVSNPRPVNLNSIIQRIEGLLRRLIGEDITLVTKTEEGELIVVADSGQIEQILMNLATNARDSMSNSGTLTIETSTFVLDERFIAAHAYGKKGLYAMIAMTDTGMGMDQHTASRIFEPFFTTKEVGRGTGLGLSMAYGIMKQHEGYINVYSEPGVGTTFKLYLPIARVAAEKAKAPQAVSLERGSETVLLAEDDESLRMLARSILEEFGYKVIEAVDGEDALEKIRLHHERIQLLLLDVIMPKMNGKQVYDEARKLMPGVKALFMSGYTADIVNKRGLVGEGMEFIPKPVSPGELLKKIRTVLNS